MEFCAAQRCRAATLSIMRIAIDREMILKDATPYNIQFIEGKPLLIDTLSFTWYDPAKPWIAYRQFCESFLYPLYLEKYNKLTIHKTFRVWPEGIPANETAALLPYRSRFNLSVWLHLYLQTVVGKKESSKKSCAIFDKKKMLNLLQHLETTIRNLRSTFQQKYDLE